MGDRLGIDLGHDQRHLGIHPPIAAFVDHQAAALDRPGGKVAGHFVRRAADGQIDPLERRGRQFFDGVGRAGESIRLPAERPEARNLYLLDGQTCARRAAGRMIVPTAPVAPTTANVSNTLGVSLIAGMVGTVRSPQREQGTLPTAIPCSRCGLVGELQV